ncbi:hypothetical protein J4E00_20390 [Siccationidurans soli]|uniref:DUF4369 domain-containing protein n=1 Tax=Hymenobacter negativus TaxID=2795026 RepID=A0ABS3QJK4_9BACT|nr:hypothetical protein [Hymenobacter negativus]
MLFALLFGFGFAHGQQLLRQEYSFIGRGLGVTKLRQSHDTLYFFQAYPAGLTGPGIAKAKALRVGDHFKIIAASRTGKFDVLKVEKLDTLKLTSTPYPETRYLLVILNRQSDNAIGFLPQRLGSTKAQIDTAKVSDEVMRKSFYFTYFSDAYMKKLAELKRVSTKEQAQQILDEMKSAEWKVVIEKYQKTNPPDFYGSGFISEFINLTCIKSGYSPIGAQMAINALLK